MLSAPCGIYRDRESCRHTEKTGYKEKNIMGREKILFKTEERRSVSEIAAFLRQLADRVEQGKVTLKNGGNEIELSMPSNMSFEIKVEEEEKHRKTRRKLEIEIEWSLGDEDEAGDHVMVA